MPEKTFRTALIQIVVADLSMSLDNVLAVAGAAREHPMVLAFGLVASVALMGVAASVIREPHTGKLLSPRTRLCWDIHFHAIGEQIVAGSVAGLVAAKVCGAAE